MTDDSPHRDDATPSGWTTAGNRDDVDDRGDTCDRCGGEAVPARSDTVPVLECADCGNVLGLVDDAVDPDAGTDAPVSTDEVTATDGELGQLVRLLRAEGTAGDQAARSIATDRLLLSTDVATLEVRATGDDVEIRLLDPGND